MKVLITGGNGFIGSSLSHVLKEPVILDWKEKYAYVAYEHVKHDIRFSLKMNGGDIAAVVHLAALTGKRECGENPNLARQINVEGTRNMLEFCRIHDIQQFVMASTCACYCEKEGMYIQTKLQGEKLCREYSERYGINTIVLRLANVYGIGALVKDKLTVIPLFILKAFLGKTLPVEGDGEQTRDFVHVNDVCNAIKKALKYSEHDTFFVGTGVETSISQLAEIVRKKMKLLYGKHVATAHVPFPNWRSKVTRADIPIDRTEQKLDWQAEINIDRGIENLLAFPSYSTA